MQKVPELCAKADHMPWVILLLPHLMQDGIYLLYTLQETQPVLHYKQIIVPANNCKTVLADFSPERLEWLTSEEEDLEAY